MTDALLFEGGDEVTDGSLFCALGDTLGGGGVEGGSKWRQGGGEKEGGGRGRWGEIRGGKERWGEARWRGQGGGDK